MPNKPHGLVLRRRNADAPDTLAYRVRAKLELSQPEMATMLGVNWKTVSAWENGRAVNHFVLPKLERLAQKHGVEPPTTEVTK